MIKPVRKILIANRGEIAVRIIRTCKKLGISTVAVYSDADRLSPHVTLADQSVYIGHSPSRESYLSIEKIVDAALQASTDAIHPGYGFLSENDAFAVAVMKAGMIFIGPSPESIRMMGNKLEAKRLAKALNIPMLPGSEGSLSDPDEAIAIAEKIGYPLLIKAAAGGGGKGMRIVSRGEELPSQVERAMSEAMSSFGDGSVFIEKYISAPRHIEIQIMADQYGHCIHMFERECSIQRRHQKIVEEAPSSVLTDEQRIKMGRDAIEVAVACHYTGAGTVEFLLDEEGHHYFLEMNTRLQVEHPVTEMITGFDLVELQIRIAEGYPLLISQDDLHINGHAIELRVYAENAAEGFMPSSGTITTYVTPEGKGIRIDEGYVEGMEIPIHYDPLISKLIAHASTREEAILIMEKAIKGYLIQGVDTTLAFGKFAITHPAFVSRRFDTRFVESNMPEYLATQLKINEVAAMVGANLYKKQKQVLILPKME